MKVNVNVVTTIKSPRTYTPLEVAGVVQPFLGKIAVTDVPNTTTVTDFIAIVRVQLGLTTQDGVYTVEKDGVTFAASSTLAENNVVENDNLKMRVTITLV